MLSCRGACGKAGHASAVANIFVEQRAELRMAASKEKATTEQSKVAEQPDANGELVPEDNDETAILQQVPTLSPLALRVALTAGPARLTSIMTYARGALSGHRGVSASREPLAGQVVDAPARSKVAAEAVERHRL